MLTNVRQFTSAGFERALIAGLLNGLVPAGLSGALEQGETASAMRILGVKTANMQLPESVRTPVTGDNTLLDVYLFASQEPVTFQLELGVSNFDLTNQTQNTAIYSISYYDFSPLGPSPVKFNDMWLLLSADAKSKKSGSPGSGYHHVVLPNVSMAYRGRNFTEVEAATYVYDVTVSPVNTLFWGKPLGDDVFNTTSVLGLEYFTENRVGQITHVPASASGQFLLDRVPTADNRVLVFDTTTGDLIAVTVDVLAKTVDYTGATAGNPLVCLFEYASNV